MTTTAVRMVDEPATTTDAARVAYVIAGEWRVTVEQDLRASTPGPTRIVIEPLDPASGGDGLQQAHLRAIPIREARRVLEAERVRIRAADVVARIPEDFVGPGKDRALARLADAYVFLSGLGVRNPITVIAKAREPHTQGTWAARIRHARHAGFLSPHGEQPALTGRARVALLEGTPQSLIVGLL